MTTFPHDPDPLQGELYTIEQERIGHTAGAALKHPAVRSLIIVEALDAVIEWREQGLVPLGLVLTGDARCRFVHGDSFVLAASEQGFDPAHPRRQFHAVMLEIDHSPCNFLPARHGAFYEPAWLQELARQLHPGGVFALWSDDPPDEPFLKVLREIFATADAQVVSFHNPLLEHNSAVRSMSPDLDQNSCRVTTADELSADSQIIRATFGRQSDKVRYRH